MKKIDFFLTMLLISLISFTSTTTAQTTPIQPADRTAGVGGSINTLAELRWVSENTEAWAEAWTLGANIDASDTENWNGGEGFQPIGSDAIPFSGTFDGQNHIISNIFINRPANIRVGFFGEVAGTSIDVGETVETDVAAEISNFGLENVNITGQTEQGGLASRIKDAVISKCFVHGGSIQAADLNASGGMTAGGLIGRLDMRIIVEDCYAICDVSAKFAGILGGAMASSGKIPWNVSRCYAAGVPTGTYIGGIGSMLQGGDFTSCYYDNTVYTGDAFGRDMQAGDEDITALATTDFGTESNFINWDFANIWEVRSIDGVTRPYFKWHKDIKIPVGGVINTLAELRWVSENTEAWDDAWTLGADIDATDTKNWNGGEGFQPIGSDAIPFSGTFDGQNHIISNIFINRPANIRVGFFGEVAGTSIDVGETVETDVAAEISNLGLENVNITGQTEQGGLASRIKDAVISKCFVHGGSIQAADLNASGGMTAGGLIGRLDMRIVVEDCYAICNVSAKFAGVLGGAMASSGKIPWNVNRCYAAGVPTGTYIGGIGSMLQGGDFTSCYYDNAVYNGDAFGRDMQAGDEDITALATTDFGTESNFINWDFANVWAIKTIDGVTRPYFSWQNGDTPTAINKPETKGIPFKYYPNPANDYIYITIDKQTVHLQIYNLSGRKVFDRVVNTNNAIDISSLHKGVYIIKVDDYTQKLIIQ